MVSVNLTMKIINSYIVKYNNSLAILHEVEGNKFYISFTDRVMDEWKSFTKLLPNEQAAALIVV